MQQEMVQKSHECVKIHRSSVALSPPFSNAHSSAQQTSIQAVHDYVSYKWTSQTIHCGLLVIFHYS